VQASNNRLLDVFRQAPAFMCVFTPAHELRNPLAPIRSGLSVMRLGGNSHATATKVLEMMERQVTHMVRLIDDLLDVARISGGKLDLRKEPVELKQVLSSAVETSLPLIEAGQHELIVDVADKSLPVEVDATRIAQVVANLLNNAAKYTPSGGRISLSARQDGDEVVISVADTGIGIPEEALATVFVMFAQIGRDVNRAQGGLGIGLSLVRRLVEMHGGTVAAASAGIGQGSTFTVRLPLAAHAISGNTLAAPQQHMTDATSAKGLKVLVVDDNEDAAITLSMILEVHGHTTEVAHDGLQALAAAREFKPAVVFLDIGLPRMNGYEVARAMRKIPELAHVVLVALTGWGAESDRALSKEAGFDYHLTKPVELATVQTLLVSLADPSRETPETPDKMRRLD
jgi:CheY-like chemotaxis protein